MSEKVTKPRVRDVDFVKACVDSSSCAEVADKTGLALASVAQRMTKLRKKGVNLAKYARAQGSTDVEGLNALIG